MTNGVRRLQITTIKSDKWVASKKVYGSRQYKKQIFITHRAAYVHLYKPVVEFVKKRNSVSNRFSDNIK